MPYIFLLIKTSVQNKSQTSQLLLTASFSENLYRIKVAEPNMPGINYVGYN
jgi:hypothetical protein